VGPALRYEAAPERRRWIIDQLHVTGFLSIPKVAEQLGVSEMTVRRDLRRLQATGDAIMVHGGVRLPHAHLRSTEFVTRAQSQSAAKRCIARHAAAGLRPDDVIALDAGTTTYPIVHELPSGFTGAIITPSVPVIHALLNRHDIRVVGLGGDLHPSSQAFVGPLAVDSAQRLRVRTSFIAAAAVDSRGIYVQADVERPTKIALMDIADEVVLLADHTKFEHSAPILLCPLERVDRLVTDEMPGQEITKALAHGNVHLEIATTADDQERLP
jgi:DeoR/GlpR family transcriptional regulator of sugar metabolism